MFSIFIKACNKYNFSFCLTTHGRISIMLIPNDAFVKLYINQEYYSCNFNKLFFKAIKEMKLYRKKRII